MRSSKYHALDYRTRKSKLIVEESGIDTHLLMRSSTRRLTANGDSVK